MQESEDRYPRPIATVDAVILTLSEGKLQVLLHRRPQAPFAGAWALPGGFIRVAEDADTEAAIGRVLREKAGATGFWVEQLATFSGPVRDPRGWSVSVAYMALVPRDRLPVETETVRLFDVDALPPLAFDHGRIVAAGLARLRGKGAYSTLPATLLGETFTLRELQDAYEVVLGQTLDDSSFRRKVSELRLVEEVPGAERRPAGGGRPSKLFRLSGDPRTFDRTLGGAV
ncbi:MAG: NUDIX hydrolase [Myxococcales bacterium]|nr:NUDIX hydrolase [Myxococcales bacterium]